MEGYFCRIPWIPSRHMYRPGSGPASRPGSHKTPSSWITEYPFPSRSSERYAPTPVMVASGFPDNRKRSPGNGCDRSGSAVPLEPSAPCCRPVHSQVQGKIHRQKMLRVHKLPACGRGGMDAVKILHHIVIICQLFHADPQPWKTASRRPGQGLGRTGSLTFLWTGFPVSLDLAGGFMGLSGTFGSRLVCIFRLPASSRLPALRSPAELLCRDLLPLSGPSSFHRPDLRRCRFRLHGSR